MFIWRWQYTYLMESIGLIVIIVWVVSKLLGGSSSSNKGGLNEIEKCKTFDSFRKK